MLTMLSSVEATDEAIEASGLVHRVHLPDGVEGKRPLVVLVHGRAGNANVMWVFSGAFRRLKPVVVSPQGFLEDKIGGWSWWEVDSKTAEKSKKPHEKRIEELKSPLLKVKSFIESLKDVYPVDLSNVYAAGFSQGAGVLSSLSLWQPEMFKSVALLSGFIPRTVEEAPEFLVKDKDIIRPKYFISHGTKDEILPFERAIQAKELLEGLNAEVTFESEDVGHKTGSKSIKALQAWVET